MNDGTHHATERDDELDLLIHRADLDGLVRLIDARTARRDWPGLARVREGARHAVHTGRQVWPAATLAEYRLALWAPGEWAAGVLDEGAGRFAVGPLTEVIAQHHSWAELAPHLPVGPRASVIAHERVLRGDEIDAPHGPNPFDIPYRLAEWEPAYALATYADDGVVAPAPDDARSPWKTIEPVAGHERLAPDSVDDAVHELASAWTTTSSGRVDVAAVAGTGEEALGALGVSAARVRSLTPAQSIAWLAWAGASGGAHGRRRGTAAGRFNALWLLAALDDALEDWPLELDDLGSIANDLRWWWWDAHEPQVGWQLQMVVEDPEAHLAWAINGRDAA